MTTTTVEVLVVPAVHPADTPPTEPFRYYVVGQWNNLCPAEASVAMPYLRITCPDVSGERRRELALRLTDALNDLFFNPRAPTSRDELREHTTVHFLLYHADDLFIGGRTPQERGAVDLTVELSDWNMSERQQRKVAVALTPLLAELFSIPASQLDGINIRFHPYPPRDFAVGGRLLADVVPRIGQWMKRVVG